MPIVGELTGWMNWVSHNEALASHSWEIDMPPSDALAKASLGWLQVTGDFCNTRVGIKKIRRLKPNNTDEELTFPLSNGDPTLAFGDGALTHVTFGLSIIDARIAACWTIEFWG